MEQLMSTNSEQLQRVNHVPHSRDVPEAKDHYCHRYDLSHWYKEIRASNHCGKDATHDIQHDNLFEERR